MKYILNETIATGKFKQVLAENYTKNFKLLCQSIKLNKVQQKILDSFINHGTIKNQYVGRVAGVKKEKKFFAAKKQYKGSIENRNEALMSALKVNTHQRKILDSYLKTGKVIGKYAGSIAGSTKATKDYSAFRGFKEFSESEVGESSKYLKYSDLMKDYAVSFAKDGGLGPTSKKIKAAMEKEKKKLGIKEGKEVQKENKYLKYSDLMKAYAVSFVKDGGLGPESKKIKAAMEKEKKKLGIKEGAEIYTVKKGSFTRKVDGKTADKMKRQGWKLVAKEEVEEANNKTAFLKRVKDRFPAADSYQSKAFAKNDFWNRIVQVVKPKNVISSKRYVELGKIFDTGNFANFQKALRDMEKKDGIKEGTMTEGTWKLPKGPKAMKDLRALLKKPIPFGKNGDYATDQIDTLIGDDSLLDDLYKYGKDNAKADARPIIKKAMKRLGIKESIVNEATGKEITLDWDMDDPREYQDDWQDQGVYLDDWNKRKMEIEVSGAEKDLLKWLIDDYGMDKKEAQNVIRKGKKVKL